MTTSVVIKPSGRDPLKGRPWTLVIRQHDLGGTSYSTICDLTEEQADHIASEKQISYLYGEGDAEARAKTLALAKADALRRQAEEIEKAAGLPTPEVRHDNARRAEIAAIVGMHFNSIVKGDDEDIVQDLMTNLLHLARRRGLDPAQVAASAFAHFRSEEFDDDAMPVVAILDNGSMIAETNGHRDGEMPAYQITPSDDGYDKDVA
jgi:hypothetical protein